MMYCKILEQYELPGGCLGQVCMDVTVTVSRDMSADIKLTMQSFTVIVCSACVHNQTKNYSQCIYSGKIFSLSPDCENLM